MRAPLISALEMVNPSGRGAFFALVFASLTFLGQGALFAQADPEPLYYIYHGQQKHLTLDADHIAVRVSPIPPNRQSAATLPMSLASRGLSESDVVARPETGWMILNAQNLVSSGNSVTRSAAATASAPASEALWGHALITSLLNDGDSAVEFVSPVFRDEGGDPVIVTPTILIGFKQDFAVEDRSNLLALVTEGAQAQKIEFPQPNDERWQIQSRDGFAVLSRANALANTSGVTYAEPDMIATGHANLVPTDPSFTSSWGLRNTGQAGGQAGFDMKATAAWDVTLGSPSVIVLILDVGVQQDHPDINQIVGQDFTSDADSNPDGGPFGVYDNHGTWVAGCVSERINNGLGTAGIAPGVKVASARCYNNTQSNGNSTFQFSWVVDALNWGQSIGARVSNNSNGYTVTSSAIESAYASTRTNGMVHFASAGNSGASYISYPASIPAVNAVGAANRFGQRWSSSQYGTGLKYLAPGVEILTTDRTGAAGGSSGDYIQVNGTSFAAPYAAGVAALIISHEPNLTAADVENLLQSSCADMGQPGYDLENGYGMIDAYQAVKPRITSNLNPASVQIGSSFSYQITANNSPTSYSATGLPAGLQLDTTAGLISGTPTASGTFQVVVIAYGTIGNATATVQIVVIGPQITSNVSNEATDSGGSFSYQITATNNPSSYDALGLPAGLQIDTTTGLITGTPSVPGTYQITIIAHTAQGDASATLQVVVKPPVITSDLFSFSIPIGNDCSYQITASKTPTSYSATGLPAGLSLDTQTGQISGVVNLSGLYTATLTAHTPYGDASGTLSITVQALVTTDVPVATLPIDLRGMVADPQRPRIYIATPTGIAVLDTETLSIIQTVAANPFWSLCISPDGSRLWFTRYYDKTIGSIDLDTLTPAQDLVTTIHPEQIREGLAGRLYATAGDFGPWEIFQVDSTTGEVQAHFSPGANDGSYDIDISPDGRTLFVGASGYGTAPSGQYDISGASPTLLRTIQLSGNGCTSVVVSHDGEKVCFIPFAPSPPYSIQERSGNDITTVVGSYGWSLQASPFAFSIDDSLAFQGAESSPVIGVFDTHTLALQRTINLPNTFGVGGLVVDNSNTFLLAAAGGGIQIYRIKPAPSNVPPKSLTNVSTRTFVQTGDNVEIGGFIIQGDQPKKVVLRAIGPSLSAYGLPAVTDPVLELHDSTRAVIATNDNWNSHRQDVLATGLAPKDEHESVIVTTLTPGAYTAILSGLNGATGTALFELYDVDPTNSRVVNISTRADVGTGDNVMIGGFIIGGDQGTKVLVRAIGPSLMQHGVSGALADPTLELHNGSGALIYQNDDWQSDQQQEISATGLAPSDLHESAIVQTLQPGNYTAIVRGKNNTTGVALVEVYNLETN